MLKFPTEFISDKHKLVNVLNWSIQSQSGIFWVLISIELITNKAL